VTLKKPGSGKALSTNGAFTWKSVGPCVHLQRRQRRVTFVAKFARKGILDLVGAMQLLMLDVSGVGRKSLFAIGTGKRLFTGGRL
jgi:hypothetical protein